jgi:hypothetical protein
MPERPDLRKIAGDIREALESYPREALADILTYVFQAYVVEGTPTVAATQPERITELEGLSFADLVTALQTRLDVPELALFEVNAGRVNLKMGGQTIAIVAERGRPAAASSAPAPAQAAAPAGPATAEPAPRPRPGVTVEEVPSSQLRPPPRSPTTPAAEAPPPRRGLSVSSAPGGRPAPAGGSAPAAQPAQPTQPAQGAAQPAAAKKPEDTVDDGAGSKRFSLLDID